MRWLIVASLNFLGAAEAIAQTSPAFWSFQTVRERPVPAIRDPNWSLTPVDRFILKELESRSIKPVELADKRTLIRRATIDLTGLPPTPEEIDAFLKDDSPNAFARVIDSLLASPAYGERWGRHWLDVVRYADTAGDNSDYPIPQMYRYRDWVIRAISADMPYDRFVREQLAGDLMTGGSEAERYQRIIATGYLANSRRFGSYEDARYPWHLTIEDAIDNLGRAFLGLTINCCRCHDHKFDPLTAEDYYALYGFFQSTRFPWPGIELDKAQRDLIPLAPPDQVAAVEKDRQGKLAEFDKQLDALKKTKADLDKAMKEAESIADEKQRGQRIAELNKQYDAHKRDQKLIQDRKERVQRQPVPYEMAYAVTDAPSTGKRKIGNACIQLKGDPEHLGPEVPRRFVSALGGHPLPKNSAGSGRLELAHWLTDPANPLTARVMVNRIWHHHFGKGLVPTPGDFGKQGQSPTHPELLDYLAKRFVDSGWSLKAMHRLILHSRVYQLSSRDDEANERIDSSNDYLWRYNRHRLDAESIRDTLLFVSGSLDRSPGGPHPFPEPSAWNFTQHNPFKAVYPSQRRSVYLMTQRIQRHPFLGLFDGPDTNSSTARRQTSTTPLQALFLMNDPFVHNLAQRFGERMQAAGTDDPNRITWAFQTLLGRGPEPEESAMLRTHINQARSRASEVQAWASVARAMFLMNEAVWVK